MTERTYTIILEPEPDGSAYNVIVPALPGCLTFGETVEEAIENAKEAIGLHIEGLIAHGQEVPIETQPARVATVTVTG